MEKVTSDKRWKVWWTLLRWQGHAPHSYDIDTKFTTDKEKTHALADIYANIRPQSSWHHLVETLYLQDELIATKEAKLFLQQNGE